VEVCREMCERGRRMVERSREMCERARGWWKGSGRCVRGPEDGGKVPGDGIKVLVCRLRTFADVQGWPRISDDVWVLAEDVRGCW